MSHTVQHELLALIDDTKVATKAVTDETLRVFSHNRELFTGEVKVTTAFADTDSKAYDKTERREITTTVMARLAYTFEALIKEGDLLAAIDATNCIAAADIVLNGRIIATLVPGVTLLNLERRITSIKNLILAAPTLPSGIAWEPAQGLGEHVVVTKYPKSTNITKPVNSVLTLAVATERHQATTEKITTDVPVAARVDTVFSGMLSAEDKAALMERTEEILAAVKTARQRANGTVVKDLKVMTPITEYILTGK